MNFKPIRLFCLFFGLFTASFSKSMQPTPKQQFFTAVIEGDVPTMSALLAVHNIDLEARCKKYTPFLITVSNNHLEAAKFLKERGANTRRCTFGSETSALHLAADTGDPAMIDFLADECGLDVNARDAYQGTPLHRALTTIDESRYPAQAAHATENVTALLKHNAQPLLADMYAQTPLYHAAALGNLATIKELTKHGAGLEITEVSHAPIETARVHGQIEAAAYLAQFIKRTSAARTTAPAPGHMDKNNVQNLDTLAALRLLQDRKRSHELHTISCASTASGLFLLLATNGQNYASRGATYGGFGSFDFFLVRKALPLSRGRSSPPQEALQILQKHACIFSSCLLSCYHLGMEVYLDRLINSARNKLIHNTATPPALTRLGTLIRMQKAAEEIYQAQDTQAVLDVLSMLDDHYDHLEPSDKRSCAHTIKRECFAMRVAQDPCIPGCDMSCFCACCNPETNTMLFDVQRAGYLKLAQLGYFNQKNSPTTPASSAITEEEHPKND